MLTIENLQVAYGHSKALHGVNLTVGEGEVVCLIGRNGVGKTSTMRGVVQDMVRVTDGRVDFDKVSLNGLQPHEVIRRGVGYVPEDRRVFPSLTVMENLSVPGPVRRAVSDPWTIERVFGLFPQLKEYRRRLGGVLSGGEQQMLAVGRSLLTNPKLLLLDEPHEGLAPRVAEEVVAAIADLKAQGVSMLVSEQALKMIDAVADTVYIIDRGMTVWNGTPRDFENDAEITRKYLTVQ